jgi:pimeloyl-ACP methyl ester carboxylesterase
MESKSTVTSADGTSIAFERDGTGEPVILIGGALYSPVVTTDLAKHLASHLTVVRYDRRGRGDSTDTSPYALEREIEDLSALITELGGAAALYGHSAGAGLALLATRRGLPVTKLVLHDVPFAPTDEERRNSRELASRIKSALSEDRRDDALEMFLTSMGLPPQIVDPMREDPAMQAIAHTIAYEFELLNDGLGARPTFLEEATGVAIPALVLSSATSPPWMTEIGRQVAGALPNGQQQALEHEEMMVPPEVLGVALADFLATQDR